MSDTSKYLVQLLSFISHQRRAHVVINSSLYRAHTGYLVGYGDDLNYKFWLSRTDEIIISAYVSFDETPIATLVMPTAFNVPFELQAIDSYEYIGCT